MDKLRVRIYSVQFGDAILISVPDRSQNGKITSRHILIDVGNRAAGKGSADFVFEPILKNIVDELGGHALDLYIMTHEHMDHVQGLLYGSEKLKINLKVDYAWFPVCSRKGYYDEPSHCQAKEFRDQARRVYTAIKNLLEARPEFETSLLEFLMAINNYAETEKCVSYLSQLAQEKKIHYVYRGYSLKNAHPFKEARFRIWAPEENVGLYAKKLKPMALEAAPSGAKKEKSKYKAFLPTPPAGVDAGAFYNLVQSRSAGFIENLLAINSSLNNTSIVFSLDWRDWRLLFTGDAEHPSWQKMDENNVLSPVNFLKVSHHGSQTGTPVSKLLDQILPESPAKKQWSVVSTYEGAYHGVPEREMIKKELSPRCQVKYVEPTSVKEGQWLDFESSG